MSNTKLKPAIYTVATAHLDTTWQWTFETTLSEYIPKTLVDNFALFEKYPEYEFSFEGSYRYELMEEYYPDLFEKLKEYVAAGRWHVAGSAYENGDVNVPSPEALIRNVLYGNDYFNKKFGKKSKDIFLPDCFGFGQALPSIAHHCNLLGFTTQKLPWSSAFGVPFDLGKWQGIDGNSIYASLDMKTYINTFKAVRDNEAIKTKLPANITDYDLPFTAMFHGVGDRGGAPKEKSVEVVCNEIRENDKNDWQVLSAASDKVFRDMDELLTDEQKSRLPVWKKELISRDHGVGSYTSRTAGKRFNRRGEQLADAAERTAVMAGWANGYAYPEKRLETAWKRVIAHQFHDDLTGTSHAVCYKRNWNDYVLSLNEFAEEYRAAAQSVASRLDTSFVSGKAVIVSNPLQMPRSEAVVAEVTFDEKPEYVCVKDSTGAEVPAQITAVKGNTARIVFEADVAPMGMKAYDVSLADKKPADSGELHVNISRLENERFIVSLDDNGDVCAVFDKALERNILSAPVRMQILNYNGSGTYPAWELCYHEVMAKPAGYPKLVKSAIKENGPARVAIEIVKTYGESVFRQVISLSKGGQTVEFFNEIDWRSTRKLLKTAFEFTAENDTANYDLGLGYIKRRNNRPTLYEVPAQMWADITDIGGSFGVSVLSDSRYGWDKPANNTLRLTGIHTPRSAYNEQSGQNALDLGLNRYSFALCPHAGEGLLETQNQALCFNMPMAAFVADTHKGSLTSEFSFGGVSDEGVIIRCIKKAQNSDEIIVRVNEALGLEHSDVRLSLGSGIKAANEVYGDEDFKAEAEVFSGKLVFDMKPFEVKTFALTLNKLRGSKKAEKQEALALAFNRCVTSRNKVAINGGLPDGEALPAEMFPATVDCGGVEFTFGTNDGGANALVPAGETVKLPKKATKLHFIAASFDGDKNYSLKFGDKYVSVPVCDAREAVGAWDLYGLGETGYIKRCTHAWNATHTHSAAGDEYGKNAFFFKCSVEIPEGAEEVAFTADSNVVILAAAVTFSQELEIASKLYDTLSRRECTYKMSVAEKAYGGASGFWYKLDWMRYGNPENRSIETE